MVNSEFISLIFIILLDYLLRIEIDVRCAVPERERARCPAVEAAIFVWLSGHYWDSTC